MLSHPLLKRNGGTACAYSISNGNTNYHFTIQWQYVSTAVAIHFKISPYCDGSLHHRTAATSIYSGHTNFTT